jgi:ATP-dependent exoDNAse (exonuclease V) beta subunit
MHLNKDRIGDWKNIISDVEKTDVPLECINKIILKLSNKRQKTLNILKLRNQGADHDDIEKIFKSFLNQYHDEIYDVNFVLDIESVAAIVQPETDKLLDGL